MISRIGLARLQFTIRFLIQATIRTDIGNGSVQQANKTL